MVNPALEKLLGLALALAPAVAIGAYILYHVLDPPRTRYYAPELVKIIVEAGEKK